MVSSGVRMAFCGCSSWAQVARPFCRPPIPITVAHRMGAAPGRGEGKLLQLGRPSRASSRRPPVSCARSRDGRSRQHCGCPPPPGPGHRGSPPPPASPACTPSLPSLPTLLHYCGFLMVLFRKEGRGGDPITFKPYYNPVFINLEWHILIGKGLLKHLLPRSHPKLEGKKKPTLLYFPWGICSCSLHVPLMCFWKLWNLEVWEHLSLGPTSTS